ncbi:MAG: hypothetical protein ACT4R6_11980 [Gemmatimonadaceae bacterium]
MLLAGDDPNQARVIFPEFTSDSTLADAVFASRPGAMGDYSLVGIVGIVGSADLTTLDTGRRNDCGHWPLGRLVARGTAATIGQWSVGFPAGGLTAALPYHTLAGLTGSDSLQLAIELARLASRAPGDTVGGLAGVGYVVQAGYRAALGDSVTLVIGELMRRLAIEASPREERITVIGERRLDAGREPSVLAFSERMSGDEESVPTTQLVALVQPRRGVLTAVLLREFSDGAMALLLERFRGQDWRVRWRGAYAGC